MHIPKAWRAPPSGTSSVAEVPHRACIHQLGYHPDRAHALIQIELLELPVLGSDPAHRAGDRAHHHGLGLDHLAAELDAAQHRAVGNAGRREQAIAFLSAHTTLSRNEAEEEVDRYIAIPGQALSYKIGEQDILDLRRRAKAALGEKFDLKRFHDAILKDGAMPLSILNAKIDRWIAAEKQEIL